MVTTPRGFTAIETRQEVEAATNDLKRKFAVQGEEIPGFGGGTYWHERLRLWGHFQKWTRHTNHDRHWNTFGFERESPRKHRIVEINPPMHGQNPRMQGVFARSPDGSRWLLHKGRMAISGKQITEDDFDKAASLPRRPIKYSDGTTVDGLPVANIDVRAAELQDQIRAFVKTCDHVRRYHEYGPKIAAQEAAIEAAIDEAEKSIPEPTGNYDVPAQAARTVERKHSAIWQALTEALDEIGVDHTNQRVGRWGPDLRTISNSPVLFEIKSAIGAADLQCAVGQLFIYDELLQDTVHRRHRKVLVLPADPPRKIEAALKVMKLDVLVFSRVGRRLRFNKDHLKRLTAKP